MKEVLFNGHDIVLMLIIGFSLLLAVRIVSSTTMVQNVRVLLAAFWGLNALWAVDTLVFWSEPIRVSAFDHSAWLPLAFNFAPFLQGPIIFLLTKAMLKPGDPLSAKDLWHFLPALLTPFYLYWACYRFPVQQQSILIVNLEILASADVCFLWFLTLKKLTPVAYGVSATRSLSKLAG